MIRNVVVVGLGLMGGSFAKAVRAYTDCKVYGWNRTQAVAQAAVQEGVLDGIADDAILGQADLVVISLYPQAAIDWLKAHIEKLKHGCLVVDFVGVKQCIVDALTPLAQKHGVHFVGGHPMAGREFSGFAYAQEDLFRDASMILVQTESSPLWAVDAVEGFFSQLGFGRVVRCSAEQHDHMIAFTSQLCHVVSSAYIKSPEALKHNGYSAGSYKDLTRVAKLNEDMWTELFLLNQQPLVQEIDEIIKHLTEYRDSIAAGDAERLRTLLRDGRMIKERIG
ncbi:MAG: prephenate dehydrogenase [Butyricicoccus pullicaecorum]|nr:prephenate dehydrogenase [Butyricicoccus pullicaecorum]